MSDGSPTARRLVSIVTPCFNEAGNVDELHARIVTAMSKRPDLDWEHLFIDNHSTDGTEAKIRAICAAEPRAKAIFNARNFGHIRSPFHGVLQAHGDCVVVLASDLQDPPELIEAFLVQWEAGFKSVVGVKATSDENALMFNLRRAYYRWVRSIADVDLVENATGFGLFDRVVVDALRQVDDPYPYFRGLLSEIGFPIARVAYHQPLRKSGLTKNNMFSLYDYAMLGMVKHSRLPLRLATFTGFVLAGGSLLVTLVYLVLKLLFWQQFPMGMAPVLLGVFFFSAVQLLFLGIIGEYVGAILNQVRGMPHVFERERINFRERR